ncbi:MAG: hypothetical protein ABGU93_09890 [Acetobacterium sp.]|uniref:hypothetical protein n=1 Tax=Acetobacterium sp. TaxID=1872094 RepID=UPI003241FB6C
MKKLMLILAAIGLALFLSGCSLIPGIFGNKSESVKNQEITLALSFGEKTGTYTGQLVKGLPQGNGVFTVSNEDEVAWTYEGAWEQGHFQGIGETVWEDGFMQEGNYKNDYLSGEGKEYLDGNLLYEGNFDQNQYDRQGILYNYYGDVIYEGDFVLGFYNETAAQRKARLDPFKAQTAEISYAEIFDNAKNETGKKVKLTGRVFQVYENYENQQYFCDFIIDANDDPNQMVQVYYRLNVDEAPLVEGQMVTVWGTVEYLYTYTTEAGEEFTIPNVEAWSVE